ncbi:MAG: 6-phospho-beta-glucosidase [Chloroflexi bacterium]|nr:6-phospho-beta-glucosidase [Chloroflexota bacterium]
MKLTLIGGGGVRAPLFALSTLKRADQIHLDELCLMDIDAPKLAIIGQLCQVIARRMGSDVRITITTDPRTAISGADYVVTSIRVGGDEGRVLDERVALRHGVLGQETTGPGGFAMALRSIPAILEYARLIDELAPGAWMFNFTNPAGLVAQALHDAGFERAVGICDGANLAQHAVATWMQVPMSAVRTEVYGLNHLSWARRAWINGDNVLPKLLQSDAFINATELRVFEPALVRAFGEWLNEYLFYYYYAERAVASIQHDERTRGEEIVAINAKLLADLAAIDIDQEPERALKIYHAANARRSATYMHYARTDALDMERADEQDYGSVDIGDEGEGYAGVALDIIEAFESQEPVHIALNVPNAGAIACMRPDDVVEVSCIVDRHGIHPLPVGAVPESQELLMRTVKHYERLTVEAIRTHSRDTAVMALMAHPLVMSYSRARTLVDEYLQAHAPYVGDWH